LLHLPGGVGKATWLAKLFHLTLIQAEAQRPPSQVRAGLGSIFSNNNQPVRFFQS